jgi:hypothetical protein
MGRDTGGATSQGKRPSMGQPRIGERMLNAVRSRLTYANTMATVAVFLALGGGAYALSGIPDGGGVYHGCVASSGALRVVSKASSCLKARTVTRGSRRVRIPAESAITWNQQGRPGANGVNGDPGPQGLQGPGGTGPAGSPAASMLTGSFPEDGNAFASPSGTTAAPTTTASPVNTLSPAATIVARDLFATSDHGLAGDETITLTVNGVDTALTCPMIGGAAHSCQDATHAVTIPPGSAIAFHFDHGCCGSNGGIVRFGWRATTP